MAIRMNEQSRATKSVAVMCSGGDAPGMNPFLRGMVRIGVNLYDALILGVRDGYLGLMRTCGRIENGLRVEQLRSEMTTYPGRLGLSRRSLDLVSLDHEAVQGLAGRGGTLLGSARCPEFRDVLKRKQGVDLLDSLGVSTVVVVGGDGSTAGARLLAKESSLQVLVVPASIDNDLPTTEMALGFDTAVSNIVWCMERCNDTAASHHRIMVLQTMGRDSGRLAKAAGLAAGAEIVVIPERGIMDQTKMEGIARRIERSLVNGHDHAIVVIAEGVKTSVPAPHGPAEILASHLESHFTANCESFAQGGERPYAEVRTSILGHLQRGGQPTAADRILAVRFARSAWQCIDSPEPHSGVLGLKNGRVCLHPFSASLDTCLEVIDTEADPETELYDTIKAISSNNVGKE